MPASPYHQHNLGLYIGTLKVYQPPPSLTKSNLSDEKTPDTYSREQQLRTLLRIFQATSHHCKRILKDEQQIIKFWSKLELKSFHNPPMTSSWREREREREAEKFCSNYLTKAQKKTKLEGHLIMFLIADSSNSALVGGLDKKCSSTTVSTPAFLRKIALWIANNPSSTTSSRGTGGGCKPQYRFRGTWKGQLNCYDSKPSKTCTRSSICSMQAETRREWSFNNSNHTQTMQLFFSSLLIDNSFTSILIDEIWVLLV